MSADAATSDDVPTAPDGDSGVTKETAVDLEQDLLARIEATSRRFKAALWAGERPRIESGTHKTSPQVDEFQPVLIPMAPDG